MGEMVPYKDADSAGWMVLSSRILGASRPGAEIVELDSELTDEAERLR